jgi:hypothetical protein
MKRKWRGKVFYLFGELDVVGAGGRKITPFQGSAGDKIGQIPSRRHFSHDHYSKKQDKKMILIDPDHIGNLPQNPKTKPFSPPRRQVRQEKQKSNS